MRCTGGKRIVDVHATRDAVSVSDGAATGSLKVAAFKPGTRAICRCQNGECAPAQCDQLYVLDGDDTRLATFHGAGWRAHSDANNPLVVYRMAATQDARPAKITIADVDRWNREAYARPDTEEQP